MSITYGFYNSLNHDRKYNAIQISKMFDGLIKDGIFMSIGECFAVTPGSGMEVIVAPGKAWFNHTWTENDADLPIPAYQSEVVLNRIDALVLEVNAGDAARANTIKFVKGTPSSNPVIPTLVNTSTVHQHLLVTVTIPAGATAITGSMITNYIGTATTPFVSGILESVSLDVLLGQWQAMLDEFVAYETNDFITWFNAMKDQLTTDAAGNLQNQINTIVAKSLSSNVTLYVSPTGSNVTGDGTQAKPYLTITKAISMIPKNLSGYDATINVAIGSYPESISISNYHDGLLKILIAGDITVNTITINNCQNVRFSADSLQTITLNSTTNTGFLITNNSVVRCNNVNITCTPVGATSILYITTQSKFELIAGTLTVYKAAYAVRSEEDSSVYIEAIAGTASYAFYGTGGSKMSYKTRTIAVPNADYLLDGATVTNQIGLVASLLTTVKSTIVDAINWMMGLLLPQTVSVTYYMAKPTTSVYGQTYFYYTVPFRHANLYTASNLAVVIVGLASITASCQVVAMENAGIRIYDSTDVGKGFPLAISVTLTKI